MLVRYLTYPSPRTPSSRVRRSHTHNVLKRARRDVHYKKTRACIFPSGHLPWATLALHLIRPGETKLGRAYQARMRFSSAFPAELSGCRIEAISARAKQTGGFVTYKVKGRERLVKGV